MDLSKVQAQSFDALPNGVYTATITKFETKVSKAGGEYYQAEFTIVSDPQKGRKFWDTFTLKNSNPKAVQVGLGRLKTMCLAAGIPEAALVNFQPHLLSGKSVKATTSIQTSAEYGDKVVVKKYEPTTIQNAVNKVAETFNTQDSIPF